MSSFDNTNSKIEQLIRIEKERYERLLHLIEAKKPNDIFSNNLGLLVNLMPNEYKAYIDLYSSYFSLKKYNIDDTVYAYDYEVSFNRRAEMYRSIVLTYLNLPKLYNSTYKIDVKNKEDLNFFKLKIEKDTFKDNFIEKTFSNNSFPYIAYSTGKVIIKKDVKLSTFYEFIRYYAKDSNLICEINPSFLSDPIKVHTEDVFSKDYVFPWIEKNFERDDDLSKLVEMAGYYNTSKKFHNLVKKI